MNAAQILAMRPSELFPGNEAQIRTAFRILVKDWHPDHCTDPDARKVFEHLTRSRNLALTGGEADHVVLTRQNGTKFQVYYLRRTTLSGREIMITKSAVTHFITDDEEMKRARIEPKLKFVNESMRKEFERYLPVKVREDDLSGGVFLVYRRNPDQILLRDLMEYQAMPDVHVMWLVSRLLNLASFMEYNGVVHCGFLPTNLLVCPKMHSVSLVGPSTFITKIGQRPWAVPGEVLGLYPRLRDKGTVLESSKLDLLTIRHVATRALGLETLGDVRAANIRQSLKSWLLSPAPDSAALDFKNWANFRGKGIWTDYQVDPVKVYEELAHRGK